MGIGPSKEKIRQILQNSCNEEKHINLNNIDYIPYRNDYFSSTHMGTTILSDTPNTSISLIEASSLEAVPITARATTVSVTQYPYCTIGTLFVTFPNSPEERIYTCFLIEANIVVTLATNIYDLSKGGKAIEIKTSFSKELISPENVFILDEDNNNKKREPFHNIAVLIYNENITNDWIGVKVMTEKDLTDKDVLLMASVGINMTQKINTPYNNNNSINNSSSCITPNEALIPNDTGNSSDNTNETTQKCATHINYSEIHETTVSLHSCLQDQSDDPVKLSRCRGGPVYYKGYDNGIYCIGFLDNKYYLQPMTTKVFHFLVKCIYKGKALKKKKTNNIEEDKIYKLDLSKNDFGPLDIKYFSEFDLINLTQLDLSSNSIKSQGAFYLSQGKYPHLRKLNLSFNEIGDEGITYISNAIFGSLEQLLLFHNNITSDGIRALCKADFIPNLVVQSLSDNPNITDEGCKWIKENKNWTRLPLLNLNRTGLTDASISLLSSSAMPTLRKIHLNGNKFTEKICNEIQAWKLTGLSIEYDNIRRSIKMGK
jgi:hypothetical protein